MQSPERKEGSPIGLEKLRDKLQRAYSRRDHYAQLYHQTKAELDETKWQLSVALNKTKQLQTQLSKVKTDSMEYQSSRNDHSFTPDRNGRISPDSGAVSISPGVESNEGHGQMEDETVEGPENRFVRSNSKTNGMNESGELKPTKRVAFRDVPPPPPGSGPQHHSYERINTGSQHNSYGRINAGPQHHSYERINGMHQPGLQRSYTFEQGDIKGPYMEGMNLKIQRTNSYSHGRVTHPQIQYSTFPCAGYPVFPHQIQHQPHFGSNFSIPTDQHRLPRVHRGMSYDSPTYPQPPPPPHILQHHQQHQGPHPPPGLPPQQSAFKRVLNQGSARMHHYENVIVPSSHIQPHPVHQSMPPQDQQKKHSYGERWTYSGLNQEEFTQLLSHLSQPNTTVGQLEISRSNLGRPDVMNAFCKELRRNSSITELSLPNNNIGKEALKTLLPTVASCKKIKELKLVNNDIGEDCLDVLKQFLENSTLKLVLLAGNEIEHHTHLLDVQLPQDLCYEGVSDNKSTPTSPESSSLPQNMKLLQI